MDSFATVFSKKLQMKNHFLFVTFFVFLSVTPTVTVFCQAKTTADLDAKFLRQVHDAALTQGRCYPWLHHLTKQVGARLAGSPQAAAAVEYTFQMLDTLGLDSVWLQPCTVPHWVRGEKEIVRVTQSNMGEVALHAIALGNSVGTGETGISGEIIAVTSLGELEKLGEAKVKGKIVLFDRPFDATKLNTFEAYGGAVDQRGSGPSEAARLGAIGVLVRSMASGLDDVPHTGGTGYKDGIPKIPACAISTNDANLLGQMLKAGPVRVFMRTTCQMLADRPSFNVIGEIRGSEHPEKIIVVGGNLDSWDVGEGAHDDGAGCVQSMDVLQLFKRLNYKPKCTIRCVLFMNEENGLRGGLAYGSEAARKGEKHLAAIESDRGGFTPRGFTVDGESANAAEKLKAMQAWASLLAPYNLTIKGGGGGADISPLKKQGVLLIGYEPDSQRYFDYHHTAADVFEVVNKRELELGTAAMASLVYLLDQHGLE